jgi:hypothetical protein
MARKASKWNLFVKKIFNEGRKNNKDFKFSDALKEASKRKSEMGTVSAAPSKKNKTKKRKTRRR